MFLNDPVAGGMLGAGGELDPIRQLAQSCRSREDFYKALQAGYGTDHASLTGGAALRKESLEASILTTIQHFKHFVAWKKIPQSKATATVDEFTRETDVGGVPGSSATAELGDIPEATAEFSRHYLAMKYLMDRRSVSAVAEVQSANGLASAIAKQTDAGTRKLITDANYLIYYGNATVNALEFDGFVTAMEALGGDHVKDMAGQTLSANAREFVDSAQLVWGQGNWGEATDYFCSPVFFVRNGGSRQRAASIYRETKHTGRKTSRSTVGKRSLSPKRGIRG